MVAPATPRRPPLNAHAKRGQSAFEFLLLATGAVLFVILAVAVVRTAINTNSNAVNNTAGGYQDFLADRSDRALYQSAINASCIGGWSFSEGSGTVAVDTSKNRNNGTLTNGSTWTTGITGGGVLLDGTNDYVSIGSPASLDLAAKSFTIVVWGNQRSNATYQRFVSKYFSGTPRPFSLQYNNPGNNRYEFQYNLNSLASADSSAMQLNSWVFLAGVFDNASQTVSLYKNGTLMQTTTGVTPITSDTRLMYIGAGDDGGPANVFNGTLDEVGLYDRALGPDEIAALYRAQSTWCSGSGV